VLALAAAVACSGLTAGALRARFYRVAVAGESMTPALAEGDFLIVRRGPPRAGEAAFGQIVAARAPNDRLLLKRVVGLPGESLRVGTAVQVNGRVLIEPYAHGATPPQQYRGLNRLADDEYFLLGDRRDASSDSRDFGPVQRSAIEGVALLRYWPLRRAGRLRAPRRELAGNTRAQTELPNGIVGASRSITEAVRRERPDGQESGNS
jgi:signal peptidase I